MFRRFFSRESEASRRLAEDIELLHNSPLVDPVWYRQTYADLRHTPVDVAHHYLEHGAAEGRNPGPLFDTKFYLKQNPDVAALGINALVHYLMFGWKQGKCPNEIFEPAWYLEQNSDVKEMGVEPLSHYLKQGWLEQRRPSPHVDLEEYLARGNYSARDNVDPLTHYRAIGQKQRIQPKIFSHLSTKKHSEQPSKAEFEPSKAKEPRSARAPKQLPYPSTLDPSDWGGLMRTGGIKFPNVEPLIDRTGRPRIMIDAAGQSQNVCLVDAFLAVDESRYEIWCLYPGTLKSWMRPDMLFAEMPIAELDIYFSSVDAVILTDLHPNFGIHLQAYLACGVVPLSAAVELDDAIAHISDAMGIDTRLQLTERVNFVLQADRLTKLTRMAREIAACSEGNRVGG